MRYVMLMFGLLAAFGGALLVVVGATKGPQDCVWFGITGMTQAVFYFWASSVSGHLETLLAADGPRVRATTGGDARRKFADR